MRRDVVRRSREHERSRLLTNPPPITEAGVNGSRVLAAALALGATTAILHHVKRTHPPAGATTLIVSLGLLDSPSELVAMGIAFVLLTGLCAALVHLLSDAVPRQSRPRRSGDEAVPTRQHAER